MDRRLLFIIIYLVMPIVLDKYLDVFCEKSGIAKSNVQRWIPIVAATQMTKGKEEEQEFLSRWIEVVDYE